MKPTSGRASVVLIISLLNIRNVQSGTERVAALKIGSKYKVLNEKIKKLCGRSVFSFVLSVHTILTSVRSALRFLRLSLSPS